MIVVKFYARLRTLSLAGKREKRAGSSVGSIQLAT